jgi:hypothetical protein
MIAYTLDIIIIQVGEIIVHLLIGKKYINGS